MGHVTVHAYRKPCSRAAWRFGPDGEGPLNPALRPASFLSQPCQPILGPNGSCALQNAPVMHTSVHAHRQPQMGEAYSALASKPGIEQHHTESQHAAPPIQPDMIRQPQSMPSLRSLFPTHTSVCMQSASDGEGLLSPARRPSSLSPTALTIAPLRLMHPLDASCHSLRSLKLPQGSMCTGSVRWRRPTQHSQEAWP